MTNAESKTRRGRGSAFVFHSAFIIQHSAFPSVATVADTCRMHGTFRSNDTRGSHADALASHSVFGTRGLHRPPAGGGLPAGRARPGARDRRRPVARLRALPATGPIWPELRVPVCPAVSSGDRLLDGPAARRAAGRE